jgi:methylaspartate mutase epsilon subunit
MTHRKLNIARWDWDYFQRERQSVVAQWRTGEQLRDPGRIADAIACQRAQPWTKFAALRNQKALEEGRVQIMAVVGHATPEDTTEHMQFSENLRPDRWYVVTDAYTRKGQFGKAHDAVLKSRQDGYSYLNGYPIVEHGIAGTTAVNKACAGAAGSDNNDEDARLAWEFCLAGGWTFGTIKSIEQNIQHSRDYPIEETIFNQQYCDRLAAHYTDNGVPILRRASANLIGWDSVGFKLAVAVTEAVLAAAQGLKHIDLSLGSSMHLLQDVAAVQTVQFLARHYLDRLGFEDASVYPWIYFFIGDWPRNIWSSGGQAAWNAAIASMSGCNGMGLKSVAEANSTPTKESYRDTIQLVSQVLKLTKGQRLPVSESLTLERQMLEGEARAIVDKLLELGDGDIAIGACLGVEAGVIDTMFSPWRKLKGEVFVARDATGAIRYIRSGNIPLPQDVAEYHRDKLAQARECDKGSLSIDWAIDEVEWAGRSIEDWVKNRGY